MLFLIFCGMNSKLVKLCEKWLKNKRNNKKYDNCHQFKHKKKKDTNEECLMRRKVKMMC
mgnify:CR=1 FL=1